MTLEAVTVNTRWYGGCAAVSGAANVNPNTLLESLGIGRNAQANLQFYHNDAAGVATEIDLGVNFPANANGLGYRLYLYSKDGTQYSYNVKNLVTGVEISGIVTVNIPLSTAVINPMYFITNNTDAGAVAQGFSSVKVGQLINN